METEGLPAYSSDHYVVRVQYNAEFLPDTILL